MWKVLNTDYLQQQKASLYTQALCLMSRIYIGAVSYEVREDMLRKAFGDFGPIRGITIGHDTMTGVSEEMKKERHTLYSKARDMHSWNMNYRMQHRRRVIR